MARRGWARCQRVPQTHLCRSSGGSLVNGRSESTDSESIGTEDMSLQLSPFAVLTCGWFRHLMTARAELIGMRHMHRLQRTEPQGL